MRYDEGIGNGKAGNREGGRQETRGETLQQSKALHHLPAEIVKRLINTQQANVDCKLLFTIAMT